MAAPPWDIIITSGDEEPIWMNTKLIQGESARIPDAGTFRRIVSGDAEVDDLENHGRHSGKKTEQNYGRTEDQQHRGFAALTK